MTCELGWAGGDTAQTRALTTPRMDRSSRSRGSQGGSTASRVSVAASDSTILPVFLLRWHLLTVPHLFQVQSQACGPSRASSPSWGPSFEWISRKCLFRCLMIYVSWILYSLISHCSSQSFFFFYFSLRSLIYMELFCVRCEAGT